MCDRVGREGEAGHWDHHDVIASAKSYFLRIYKMDPRAGVRNLREMETLCTALDDLALGRCNHAADVLVMRLKALEMSIKDNGWTRARFLELVDLDEGTLVEKEEEVAVTKEAVLHQKLNSGKGSYEDYSQPSEKGKGYGKYNRWSPSLYYPGGKKGEKGAKGKKGKKGEKKGDQPGWQDLSHA